MTREEKIAAIKPLVERMSLASCWIKTANGPRHIDKPFDMTMLSEHVMGGNAYGLCPIRPGESTTMVAALDLDSHKGATPWEEMLEIASSIAYGLEIDGYHPVMYRSSGGQGIHIYLIWDKPQDAYSVREMLRAVLIAENFSSGTGGVAEGEIEIFPKQNEVPKDGYGNMFILPGSGASEPCGVVSEWVGSPDVPVLDAPVVSAPSDRATPPELDRVAAALAAIPNHGAKELNYDEWRNIIFAIHHATDGSDDGLALAHSFSAKSSKYDPGFLDTRVWPYIRNDRDGSVVTERTLFVRAANEGWVDPALFDDFEVVADAPAPPGDDFDVVESESATDAGAAAGEHRYNFVPAKTFKNRKPPGYIVAGVLPKAELVVVYGQSGSGKTFFVLDLVESVARGVAWRDRAVERGRVGYVVAEGAGGFSNRLKAYDRANDLTDSTDLFVLADAPNFTSVPHVKDVIYALKRAGPFSIVVVDTLAQVMPGANENSGEDMGLVINHCKQIHKKTGALVILIHHSGKDAAKGARGWSGLRGAMDAEIEVVRENADREAMITKMKDGEEGAKFGFKLKQVVIDDEGSTSAVVEHGEAVARDRKAAGPKGDKQRVVTAAVRSLIGLDGALPDTEKVISAAVAQVPFDAGLGKPDRRREHCTRALESLIAAGTLVVIENRIGFPSEE